MTLCTASNQPEMLSTVPELSAQHSVQVWDSQSLQCLRTLEGHEDNVRVLAVGESYVFSGSWDKSIRSIPIPAHSSCWTGPDCLPTCSLMLACFRGPSL